MSNYIFDMNNRKKNYTFCGGNLFLMIVLIASLILWNSCVESKRSKIYPLVQDIKRYNNPIFIGNTDDIELIEDTVVFSFTSNESDFNLDFYAQHTYHAKEIVMMGLCANQNDKEWNKLLYAIIDNDIYIKVCFTLQDLNKKPSIILSPSEIKDGFKKYREFSPYRLRIMAGLIIMKYQLPMKIDEITTGVECKLKNNKLYYIYKVEESDSFDMNNVNKAELKKLLLTNIQEEGKNNKNFKLLLENCYNCNIPLVYQYIGTTTNNIIEIVIECHEYESMLKPFYEKYKLQ